MKIITALVTPFNPDLSINYPMVDRLIQKQIDEGADGIVIGGTTGEANLLDNQEMFDLYHYVVKYAKKIPIYLGVGNSSTSQTIKLIKRFHNLDVAGFLVVVPYYVLPPQKGIVKHFQMINEVSLKPIILYHIPKRTGITMKIESLQELKDCAKITMIKDASLDKCRLVNIKKTLPMKVYIGDDSLFLWGIKQQMEGIISVISNSHLTLMKQCLESKKKWKDFRLALSLLKGQPNPIGIKKLLKQMGYSVGAVRLPLSE
jgi:4-hydroxy-tetrahydrodipicolinate synthase